MRWVRATCRVGSRSREVDHPAQQLHSATPQSKGLGFRVSLGALRHIGLNLHADPIRELKISDLLFPQLQTTDSGEEPRPYYLVPWHYQHYFCRGIFCIRSGVYTKNAVFSARSWIYIYIYVYIYMCTHIYIYEP